MTGQAGGMGGRGVILLGLHDGAAHLADQLQSFEDQTLAEWDLLVSDDLSSDSGPRIVQAFAARWGDGHRTTLLAGPGRGFVRNFFHLLRQVPADAAFAALSDQDDVWFPDKLARAVAMLATVPKDRPALYCARTIVTAEDLTPLRPSPLFGRPPGFCNALVQSAGGGNTMVLNRSALNLVAQVLAGEHDATAHDLWLYQIISGCGGVILRDPSPVLYYRQHGRNTFGANTSLKGRVRRLQMILGRQFSAWNAISLRELDQCRAWLLPEACRSLDLFAQARRGPLWRRLRALRASGVYRQSRIGTLALYVACVLNRL